MANVKKQNATRAQTAKALHDKNVKQAAAENQTLRAMYLKEKDEPVLLDILKKSKTFIKYHHKLAQDGVGARPTGYKLEDGSPEVENYHLNDSQIAGEMKKAAGIQELIDYIERMIEPPKAVVKKQNKS